jgi:hypothetical protein
MRRSLLLPLVLIACGGPTTTVDHRPDFDAPLDIDGVHLFIPVRWNRIGSSDPRPWSNGLLVDTGGWGEEQPRLGPLAIAKPLPTGQFYRYDSTTQPLPDNHVDPFLRLTFTFEFPLRPKPLWYERSDPGWGFPFNIDQLEIVYRTAAEGNPPPYTELLADLRPSDGIAVGSGWREVTRTFERSRIRLRFDAEDWRTHPGPLPRRLAATFDLYHGSDWAHYTTLGPPRWSANFGSLRLPVTYWRARYDTADQLFAWLRTPPDRRNPARQFPWWTKGQYRPVR